MKKIHIRILTNDGTSIEDEAQSICSPGYRGYVGFLYNHAPLVTLVDPGTLSWRRPDGDERSYKLGSGILEISHNQLTLLVQSCA